jgi:hypothetical protein
MTAPAALVDIRRGRDGDSIEFTDVTGKVLIAHAHGIHPEERQRTREALLKLLAPLVERPA